MRSSSRLSALRRPTLGLVSSRGVRALASKAGASASSAATPVSSAETVLRPDETVTELDKFIIGQNDAKVAVAIALRDQWRRKQLSEEFQNEILPNNILMVGPTGVGKTEVARRLAALAQAPFLKVEATKYTEVGIYGSDTETMVADLVDVAVRQVEARARDAIRPTARESAVERVAKAIKPQPRSAKKRAEMREKLRNGMLDDDEVAISLPSGGRGGGSRGGQGLPPMPMGMPRALQDEMKKLMKSIAKESASLAAFGAKDGKKAPKAGTMMPMGMMPMGSIVLSVGDDHDVDAPSSSSAGADDDDESADGVPKVRVGEALERWEEAMIEEAVSNLDEDETDAEAIRQGTHAPHAIP